MLNCFLEGCSVTSILAAVDAANTAAATSDYVDVSGHEGQIGVILDTGIVDGGSITYSFLTAEDDGGTGEASIVPVTGAPTVVTTSNDPLVQMAVFDATQLKGFIKVVGTVATGGVLVSYTVVGLKKYAN